MDKTPFSKRIAILSAIWYFYGQDESQPKSWRDYISRCDIGLPLAYMVNQNLVTLTTEGSEMITQTWEELCSMLAVNPYPTPMYDTLDQMIKLEGELDYEGEDE